MAVVVTAGAGTNIETFQRVGSDHRQVLELGGLPTFVIVSNLITGAANRFQFVIYNNNATAKVQIRKVVYIPNASAAVTGILASPFTQRLRIAPTTAPSGTGGATIQSLDSADTLPASISAFTNPSVSPAGGTTNDLSLFQTQADEVKTTPLDAPSIIGGYSFCGTTLFGSNIGFNMKDLTLRLNQCYEIQQGATAGTTSNGLIFVVMTVI